MSDEDLTLKCITVNAVKKSKFGTRGSEATAKVSDARQYCRTHTVNKAEIRVWCARE